jgi:hypothetical protein
MRSKQFKDPLKKSMKNVGIDKLLKVTLQSNKEDLVYDGKKAIGRGRGSLGKVEVRVQTLKESPGKKQLKMKKGGMVKSSASKRADGIAKKGKTKGRMV